MLSGAISSGAISSGAISSGAISSGAIPKTFNFLEIIIFFEDDAVVVVGIWGFTFTF